jgi:prepilin-type N-terminal cleavage/methylation domain-containing protein
LGGGEQQVKKNNQGFTLIELLIVIIIIGILSGVLIAVINPFRQQSRAKNATIRASINKIAFGINTARAGMGRLPAETELTTELENLTLGPDCEDGDDVLDCTFELSGTNMPLTCTAGEPVVGAPAAGDACRMRLVSTGTTLVDGQFRVISKKFKLDPADPDEIYIFDASNGLFECAYDVNVTGVDLVDSCVRVTE